MDEDTLETHLNRLKELVLDEHKIITYISLSTELCIHVNEAKYLLRKLVEDIRKTQPNINLNINYIISGLVGNNRAITTVCTEIDVATQKSMFKTLFFQHIYSISKGVPSVDNVAFVALNNFEDFPLCRGLIRSNSCLKHTLDEIGNLKLRSQETVDEPKSNNLPPIKKEINKDPLKSGFVKINETKSEPIIKSEKLSPKKDLSITSNDKTINKKNVKKPTKGIAGFFTKANSMSSTTKAGKATVQDVKNEDLKVENMEVDDVPVETIKKELENTKEEQKNRSSFNLKGSFKKNDTLNQIRKNAKVDKKRKRVLCVSDSDSENEINDPFADEQLSTLNHESEDEIPPTPSANTVKITSGILNPKKRRKIVDKTYTDDDGYILTRKEEIYESCSEKEEEEVNTKENVGHVNVIKIETEVSPKENKTKNSKKKVSPPQKGRQATLMNFFKKI